VLEGLVAAVRDAQYDANNLLTAITTPPLASGCDPACDPMPRPVVRLHYTHFTNFVSQPFDPSLNYTVDVPNPAPWMLDAIYYPGTQTGFSMIGGYTPYGVLSTVTELRRIGFTSSGLTDQGTIDLSQALMTYTRTFHYFNTPLYALPRYIALTEDWASNDTGAPQNTSFLTTDNGSQIRNTIQYPDGSCFIQNLTRDVIAGQPQWDDGLVASEYINGSACLEPPFHYRSIEWGVNRADPLYYDTPRIINVVEQHDGNTYKKTHFDYNAQHNEITALIESNGVGTGQRLRSARFSYLDIPSRNIWGLPTKVEVFEPNDTRVAAARCEIAPVKSGRPSLER
jgi:hypothetical protein